MFAKYDKLGNLLTCVIDFVYSLSLFLMSEITPLTSEKASGRADKVQSFISGGVKALIQNS